MVLDDKLKDDQLRQDELKIIEREFSTRVKEYYKQKIPPTPIDEDITIVVRSSMDSNPGSNKIFIETDFYPVLYEGKFLKPFDEIMLKNMHKKVFIRQNFDHMKDYDEVEKILKDFELRNSAGIDYKTLHFDVDNGKLTFEAYNPLAIIGVKWANIIELAQKTGWKILVNDKAAPDKLFDTKLIHLPVRENLTSIADVVTPQAKDRLNDMLVSGKNKLDELFPSMVQTPSSQIPPVRESTVQSSPIQTSQSQSSNGPTEKIYVPSKFADLSRDFLRLTGLGGCMEVGRSSLYLEAPKEQGIIFDFGASFTKYKEAQMPLHELVDLKRVKSVILSHVHADHLCGMPLLYRLGYTGKVLTHKFNTHFMGQICEDYLDVYSRNNNGTVPYDLRDINNMLRNVVELEYDQEYLISRNISMKLLNAGHILGSAMPLIKINDELVLFTGDLSLRDSNLLKRAVFPDETTHVISEGTYGSGLNERPYLFQKKEFVSDVKEALSRGGTVVIPSFSIGRSQDVLYTLLESGIDVDIHLDGMIREFTPIVHSILKSNQGNIYLNNKNSGVDLSSDDRLHPVHGRSREELAKDTSKKIILTTSGMGEGLAEMYCQHIIDNPLNFVAFVGYQTAHSTGRRLLDITRKEPYLSGRKKEILFNNGIKKEIRATVNQYNFSAHADGSELRDTLVRQNPENIVLVHGDPKSLFTLRDSLLKDYEAFGKHPHPKVSCINNGDSLFLTPPYSQDS
ncbi:MAG: MBL fold metallo-hydrolase RNA specificity domain-containing protein [Candidatus Woesearchaeota archaeon]